MQSLFNLQNILLLLLSLVLFGCKAFALTDAIGRPGAAYAAADKQTKNFWLLILGLAVVLNAINWNPIGLLNVIGTVAAFVYLAEARPALKSLQRR